MHDLYKLKEYNESHDAHNTAMDKVKEWQNKESIAWKRILELEEEYENNPDAILQRIEKEKKTVETEEFDDRLCEKWDDLLDR